MKNLKAVSSSATVFKNYNAKSSTRNNFKQFHVGNSAIKISETVRYLNFDTNWLLMKYILPLSIKCFHRWLIRKRHNVGVLFLRQRFIRGCYWRCFDQYLCRSGYICHNWLHVEGTSGPHWRSGHARFVPVETFGSLRTNRSDQIYRKKTKPPEAAAGAPRIGRRW